MFYFTLVNLFRSKLFSINVHGPSIYNANKVGNNVRVTILDFQELLVFEKKVLRRIYSSYLESQIVEW